jgi:glucan phosphoethanolaminetransferase (alkaline phosphatase superfamily)
VKSTALPDHLELYFCLEYKTNINIYIYLSEDLQKKKKKTIIPQCSAQKKKTQNNLISNLIGIVAFKAPLVLSFGIKIPPQKPKPLLIFYLFIF